MTKMDVPIKMNTAQTDDGLGGQIAVGELYIDEHGDLTLDIAARQPSGRDKVEKNMYVLE